MAVSSLDRDTVRLLPGILRMEEDPDMTLYYMTDWHLEFRYKNTTKEGLRMWVTMQRKPLTEILTTYLPTILLLLITYATTLFKPYYFEAALTVNLTNMLVMSTIFIGVMQSLPKTAYVKMIDVWLIGCQLVPFIEVVLLTAMEHYREGDGSGETGAESPVPEDKGSPTVKVAADGTKTLNHHGSPRVVQLGQYEAPQAAPAALATVEGGPTLPPSPPDTLDGEEEKTRKKKYIKCIKFIGECFTCAFVHYRYVYTFNIAFTETRVLPGLVVSASLAYSVMAAVFYY
jgi:hypothetical protein